jgi:hypothetical protein
MSKETVSVNRWLVWGKAARFAAGLAIRCLLVDVIMDVLRLAGL